MGEREKNINTVKTWCAQLRTQHLVFMTTVYLDAKHITVLLLTEVTILLRLPYVSAEGFIFSTNSAITATFVSIFLLMVWYSQQQMKVSTTTTIIVWEHVCVMRRFVLTVFCMNLEFAIRSAVVLGLFHFMVRKTTHPADTTLSTCICSIRFAIPVIFSCFVGIRVLLKHQIQYALVPLVNWGLLEESGQVSYIIQKLYAPWVLVAVN